MADSVTTGPRSVRDASEPADESGSAAAPEAPRARGSLRRRLGGGVVFLVLGLLFVLPWGTLFAFGVDWPFPVFLAGTVLFAAGLVSFPYLMAAGHGKRHDDRASRIADTMLGVVWVLFTWSVVGGLAHLVLMTVGLGGVGPARAVAVAVAVVSAALLGWGHHEAMRVPRVRRQDVTLPRLGAGLDGTRVVVLTDTHYGPIDRARWSARVTEVVNTLDADVVIHAGDIADGTAERRREQSAPLGAVRARHARVYVTGNHEYYSGAEGWLDRMGELGWELLRNSHVIVERGGDRLVVAGVDDVTAESSGLAGHRADLRDALAGTDQDQPVLLVAHQPKFVATSAAAGVDLQISGHTHGGQIWPFHYLVRVDQPVVSGLSHHGERTHLYTSRGTGFWGPPFRVFAPSEITLLTLRAA
ncbi:putative MPP superfamily phosphohydrolase [Streptacidiphilus sp. MAP12-33]|uniref:metallophosphoesterase n=1 Tax=Streptacidiphilus sp. MAP12-33 TaxID=3156266 RepID=UPI003515D3F0